MVTIAIILMFLTAFVGVYNSKSYNFFQKADKYLHESLGKLEENEFEDDIELVKEEFLVATEQFKRFAISFYIPLLFLQGINTIVLFLALIPGGTVFLHSTVNIIAAICNAGAFVLIRSLHGKRYVIRSACSYIWNLIQAINQNENEYRKHSDDPSLN